MNYHRTHSKHVAKVAASPCHAGGGAVQHNTAVHKESSKEVDGDCYDYDERRRGHRNSGRALRQQAHLHHETYEEIGLCSDEENSDNLATTGLIELSYVRASIIIRYNRQAK
ncbi:hypothetical protein HU200_054272 [Digitaria exilis]|uniref:Uncharacterized protein n=1 Tax=Digitaria exilis TaxID=1010633 RepID=A0A835E4C1_9POAL|nr:hypothetical protein HU200_054272 [Digitaria exilis]